MAGKSLSYVLVERKLNVGPKGKQIMQIAQPTKRRRVDFESFCAQVARATTFTRQEVAAVLSYSTEIAREIVASGDIVEFGDLGTPSAKYFTLNDVSYEQVSKSKKKSKL